MREQQTEFKTLFVDKIDGADNPADTGTKPLPLPAFEKHLRMLMNLGDRSLRETSRTRDEPVPGGNVAQQLHVSQSDTSQTVMAEAAQVMHMVRGVVRTRRRPIGQNGKIRASRA